MVVGTCNFVSFNAATRYFMEYEGGDICAAIQSVHQKLEEKSIQISKPCLHDGEKLVLIDNGLRYGIKTI